MKKQEQFSVKPNKARCSNRNRGYQDKIPMGTCWNIRPR